MFWQLVLRFLRSKFQVSPALRLKLLITSANKSDQKLLLRSRLASLMIERLLRRRVTSLVPTVHPPLSLLDLPVELRVAIYENVVRGAEASRDLEVLHTCRQLYHEVSSVTARLRHMIVYVVPDAYWRHPWSAARDRKLYQALTVSDRRGIDVVKFIGDDNNMLNWAPDLALITLANHQIQPSKVILYHAFNPITSGADVDTLANAANALVTILSRITRIFVCNVPQNLVYFLGCRLLNLWFVPGMDIQKMTDDLLEDFHSSGDEHLELFVATALGNGATSPVVAVHMTNLPM